MDINDDNEIYAFDCALEYLKEINCFDIEKLTRKQKYELVVVITESYNIKKIDSEYQLSANGNVKPQMIKEY